MTKRQALLEKLAVLPSLNVGQRALKNALEVNRRTIYFCPINLRLADGSNMECDCCKKTLQSLQSNE